jgi:(2Fe-2S) ferredoxin
MNRQSEDPAPFYRLHMFFCINERPPEDSRGSCAAKGSGPLFARMKIGAKKLGLKNIRINQSGCLDRCRLGPVVVIYPEGVWYSVHTEADVDEILERHVRRGERVERLMLRPHDRVPRR